MQNTSSSNIYCNTDCYYSSFNEYGGSNIFPITITVFGQSSTWSNSPDLLDLLLSAVDDEGKSFNDQEIKNESLTFVLAGSETTGNLMVWMLYVLMTNENVLQACREEVDRVLPN
ncbi:unnamed protein product, partial [Rotaria sp. Silwood1]